MTTARSAFLISATACLLLTGCRVSKPGHAESSTVQWFKMHVSVTTENIKGGKDAFGHYCVVCHGLDGQNTGVPFAATLSPPVPSLASDEVQRYSDGQLKW